MIAGFSIVFVKLLLIQYSVWCVALSTAGGSHFLSVPRLDFQQPSQTTVNIYMVQCRISVLGLKNMV